MKKNEKAFILMITLIITYLFIFFSSSILIYLYEKKDTLNYIKYQNIEDRKIKDIKRMEIYLSKKLNLGNAYFDLDNEGNHIYLTNKESIGSYKIKEIVEKGKDIYLILYKKILDIEIYMIETINYKDDKVIIKEIKIYEK